MYSFLSFYRPLQPRFDFLCLLSFFHCLKPSPARNAVIIPHFLSLSVCLSLSLLPHHDLHISVSFSHFTQTSLFHSIHSLLHFLHRLLFCVFFLWFYNPFFLVSFLFLFFLFLLISNNSFPFPHVFSFLPTSAFTSASSFLPLHSAILKCFLFVQLSLVNESFIPAKNSFFFL